MGQKADFRALNQKTHFSAVLSYIVLPEEWRQRKGRDGRWLTTINIVGCVERAILSQAWQDLSSVHGLQVTPCGTIKK
jgi:hypothetical protein